jgi:hypothetical protein
VLEWNETKWNASGDVPVKSASNDAGIALTRIAFRNVSVRNASTDVFERNATKDVSVRNAPKMSP